MVSLDLALFQSFSIVAAIFSGFVVLSGLLFNVMLSPTRPFSHIIFFISLCDMIASIGNSFGFPQYNSYLCIMQSLLTIFFFPASWLWTAALVYQIYCMVVYKRLWLKLYMIHIICWSLSLILLLAPLSTNIYGTEKVSNEKGICHFTGKNVDYAIIWVFVIFVVKSKEVSFQNQPNEVVDLISTFYGLALAIVFFSNSERVRTHWYNLLSKGNYTANYSNVINFNDDEEIVDDTINEKGVELQVSVDGATTTSALFMNDNSIVIDVSNSDLTNDDLTNQNNS
eukprot:gene13793-18501_t